jgi:glucuronate isomerase
VKNFINDNWLLSNEVGRQLYHDVAAHLPVVDYHNHLNPLDLSTNRRFRNLHEVWVKHDPYKHRAMRICGVPEQGITGNAGDYEKFENWMLTLPKTLGNPLFHWSYLEMKRVFGIDLPLDKRHAPEIWEFANELLHKEDFRSKAILSRWKVDMACTSDDLLDDLEGHRLFASSQTEIVLKPSLRGDSILDFCKPAYTDWVRKLGELTGHPIHELDDLFAAVMSRLEFFTENGCVLADHALDSGFTYKLIPKSKAEDYFKQVLQGAQLESKELKGLQSYFLHALGLAYGKKGWILQLHIGAQRHTSSRLRQLVGPAGGFASMGKACDIASLCRFLDDLEREGVLPQVILYTLNPADNAALASLTGSFTEDGVQGKIQFGPAWWYNDHFAGIRKQLLDLSSNGLLSTFIGMTTDSRSILSLSRHEYFRRILCDLLGSWVKDGKIPQDMKLLEELVQNISYRNIKSKIEETDRKCQHHISKEK